MTGGRGSECACVCLYQAEQSETAFFPTAQELQDQLDLQTQDKRKALRKLKQTLVRCVGSCMH